MLPIRDSTGPLHDGVTTPRRLDKRDTGCMSRPFAVTIIDGDGAEQRAYLELTTGELDTPQWRGVINPVPEGMRLGAAVAEGSPLIAVSIRLEEGVMTGHTATATFGARIPDGAEVAGLSAFGPSAMKD